MGADRGVVMSCRLQCWDLDSPESQEPLACSSQLLVPKMLRAGIWEGACCHKRGLLPQAQGEPCEETIENRQRGKRTATQGRC